MANAATEKARRTANAATEKARRMANAATEKARRMANAATATATATKIIKESGYHYKTLKYRLLDIIKKPNRIFKPVALYLYVLKEMEN